MDRIMRTETVFTSAVDDAARWLDEICGELGWVERRDALHVLRAALHALRDRLGVEQNAHLAAQLPTLIRGLYFEGWRPGAGPHRERHLDEYLDEMLGDLGPVAGDEIDAYEAARAAYRILERHVSRGEIRKVVGTLPHEIRTLWDPIE